MQVYKCPRCGSVYDFVNQGDHPCQVCGADLEYQGFEVPYWGIFAKRDIAGALT